MEPSMEMPVEYVSLVREQVLRETPEERARRVRSPLIMGCRHRVIERPPHERPFPWVPEILQPDVIEKLQERRERFYALAAA
jgi:hypothetical protein